MHVASSAGSLPLRATVVLTIALGLGLNAALFTIFNHYVLRPFAIREPQRVFAVSWLDRAGGQHRFGWSEFQRLSTDSSNVADLAATRSSIRAWMAGRWSGSS